MDKRIPRRKDGKNMFVDKAKIYVRSGKGGDGHVSFLFRLADRMAVTAARAAMLSLSWTKG